MLTRVPTPRTLKARQVGKETEKLTPWDSIHVSLERANPEAGGRQQSGGCQGPGKGLHMGQGFFWGSWNVLESAGSDVRTVL